MNPVQFRRLVQEAADTYQSALVGGTFYLLAWMVVGAYGGAFARMPLASWGLALAFATLAGARFLHRPRPSPAAGARVAWLYRHWGIVLATTALWGGVFCWTMLDPGFERARTASLLSTLGLATAIAHTFSMRRGFALAGLGLLYLPGLVLLWGDPSERATALVMTIYLVYVVISLLRSHAGYQHRLDLDQQLRDQRDLFARQSQVDPLTDLANRRHFSDALAAATADAHAGAPTLLLLDLDHFKQINDSHGHAIGDACLVAVARRLRNAFAGEGELVARLGGEEFGVVLPAQEALRARARAERFRVHLAEHPVDLDGVLIAVTTSIGLAGFDPARDRDHDGLYRAADSALYLAKAAGRDRVCAAEPGPPPGPDQASTPAAAAP